MAPLALSLFSLSIHTILFRNLLDISKQLVFAEGLEKQDGFASQLCILIVGNSLSRCGQSNTFLISLLTHFPF